MERFGCDVVRVRAAKPEPPIPIAIEEVGVEVVRERAAPTSTSEDERDE